MARHSAANTPPPQSACPRGGANTQFLLDNLVGLCVLYVATTGPEVEQKSLSVVLGFWGFEGRR